MADLVAKRTILYGQKEYRAGETLPSDAPLAETWVECGSAIWREEPPADQLTAAPASATPGLPGLAVGGEQTGDDLVGKVPPTRKRRKA